jgi:hypothetical protein
MGCFGFGVASESVEGGGIGDRDIRAYVKYGVRSEISKV